MTAPKRVLISDAMSSRAAEILSASSAIQCDELAGISAEDLLAKIGDYHGLLVRSRSKATAAVIENAHNLQVIGRAGIGVDNIDLVAASRRGIIVENAPSGNAITTAEHAICLLLSLVRNIPKATASMKDNKWEKKKLAGNELYGKNFGVIGLGNIGRIVADRGLGLKMKVIGYDPFIGAEAAARLGVELVELEELLTRADFMSIHTPLTNDTRGLISRKEFAMMREGAFLVNAARGGIVDEEACVEALNAGKLAGAAFDVFTKEPPPADHPLVMHPNVITTPHLGASTDEAQEKVAVEVAQQMVDFFETGEVRNAVNVAPLSSELRGELGPWIDLSRKLGSMLGQLLTRAGHVVSGIEVEVVGDTILPGATAFTDQALVGVLECFSDKGVNSVNARLLAKDRDLEVKEVKTGKGQDLITGLAVTGVFGDEKYTVRGTLYHVGDELQPRVVQINEFLVEMAPTGILLVVRNQDRPGVIGAVGTMLGEKGVNVTSMHVAKGRESNVALALWSIDKELDDETLEAIRNLPLVGTISLVRLD